MARPEDRTVLVVDDEPDIRMFLSTALEEAGFEVVTASDGNEALERVRERVPDFISLDLVMPGKTGIKLFHELRRNKEWSKIPVMVVTGHAQERADELAEIAGSRSLSGPGRFMEKPVKAHHYVKAVADVLQVDLPADVLQEAAAELRSEIRRLLDRAPDDLLREILALLRGRLPPR